MSDLKRVTKDELIINILALWYNTTVAEVLRILNEEQAKGGEIHGEKIRAEAGTEKDQKRHYRKEK